MSNASRNIADLIHYLFPKTGGTGFISTKCRLSCTMNIGSCAATHPELLVHVSVNAGCNAEQMLVLPTHHHELKIKQPYLSHPDSSHTIYTLHTDSYTLHGLVPALQVCVLCRLNPCYQCLSG